MHDYIGNKGLIDRYTNLYIHQRNQDMHEYIDSKGLKVWFLRSKSSGSFKWHWSNGILYGGSYWGGNL